LENRHIPLEAEQEDEADDDEEVAEEA